MGLSHTLSPPADASFFVATSHAAFVATADVERVSAVGYMVVLASPALRSATFLEGVSLKAFH